jgi:hypothetical protein
VSVGPLALGILGAAGALVALSLYVCGRAVASVAADELKGWLPHIAAGIIATAVRRLPETERARYDEEWLGELLAYQDRPVTALIFAVGVRRRVSQVVNELPSPTRAPAPDPSAEYLLPIVQPWVWNADGAARTDDADRTDSADRRARRTLTRSEFAWLLRKVRDDAWLTDGWLSEELGYPKEQIAAWMAGTQLPPTRDVVAYLEHLFVLSDGLLVERWEHLRRESDSVVLKPAFQLDDVAWVEARDARRGSA